MSMSLSATLPLKQIDLPDFLALTLPSRHVERLYLPRIDRTPVGQSEGVAFNCVLRGTARALLQPDDEAVARFGALQGGQGHSAGRDAEEGALPWFRPFMRCFPHVLGRRLHTLR